MRRHRLDEKEFSEINITPFTDIVLVLLIIFMITSPFLVTGSIKVNLPKSTFSDDAAQNKIEIYLTAANEVYINQQKVAMEQLPALLQQEFIVKGNEVILKADETALHGNVIRILDLLKGAGAKKFMIATTKK